MNKLILRPDEEIRTEMIRLYLDQNHPAILRQLQSEVMAVTNHIVRSRRDVKEASIAYALRHGLVGPAPTFPRKPELPTPVTDEEKKAVKEAWAQFRAAEKKARKEHVAWVAAVLKAVKGIPELEWRKDKYQDLRRIYYRSGSAVLYRDTVKRVNGTKRAKPKNRVSECSLVWCNSEPVQTGSFYGTRRGAPFYNALVKVPGVGPILGRLRRPLPGKPIQGVTLTEKADGWYAAVKCIVKKRVLPYPTLPAIGVDVGQTDLVALSDGYTERNIRDSDFVALKAAIQEKGDRSGDPNVQAECRRKVARLDQSRKRRIVHWLNSDLLPRLSQYSTVYVEKLTKGFKSDRGPLSCMHLVLDAIKLRLGDRVREVKCAHTSQTCSHCGNVDGNQRTGKYFRCLVQSCLAELDADVNAARNVLVRGLELPVIGVQ